MEIPVIKLKILPCSYLNKYDEAPAGESLLALKNECKIKLYNGLCYKVQIRHCRERLRK